MFDKPHHTPQVLLLSALTFFIGANTLLNVGNNAMMQLQQEQMPTYQIVLDGEQVDPNAEMPYCGAFSATVGMVGFWVDLALISIVTMLQNHGFYAIGYMNTYPWLNALWGLALMIAGILVFRGHRHWPQTMRILCIVYLVDLPLSSLLPYTLMEWQIWQTSLLLVSILYITLHATPPLIVLLILKREGQGSHQPKPA